MIAANHQRYLLSRFRHIEEISGEAIRALAPADDERLFRRVMPDATPEQRKILADYLAQVRWSLLGCRPGHAQGGGDTRVPRDHPGEEMLWTPTRRAFSPHNALARSVILAVP